ncbi:MAG: GIY-YIG nuclease family protein [Candidatus Binataceae bacterium]
MSNRTHVLYIGFTNDLTRRVTEHQAGLIAGFTQGSVAKLVEKVKRRQDPAS